MSLFGRKKRPPSAADVPLPEEADRRWQGACRANPQVYQPRDSGALLGVLTLTESVDTLLPLHPEHLWTADGQPVSRWILCLVSLQEDRVCWDRWSTPSPCAAFAPTFWRSLEGGCWSGP